MNRYFSFLAALGLGLASNAAESTPAGAETRCFELRTYQAAPGKLKELHARFREHANRLFQKHGMTLIGYWVPMDPKDGSEDTLVYLLAYPNREARDKSWKAFMDDAEWKAAFQASEVNGKLVAKVKEQFLEATDYSPRVQPSVSAEPRVFEWRTYTAAPGRLSHLNARFRDHTVALFTKHGINNVGYWTLTGGQPGAGDTLIYLLSHKSREAAAESFKHFGADSAWKAALKGSEEKAGGPLTVPGGVKSMFLKATDYSPMR